MLLRTLEIHNHKSIQHVELSGLQKVNVLIGRNNSGKSSIFGAIQQLRNSVVDGRQPSWPIVLAEGDETLAFQIRLVFTPSEYERRAWFGTLLQPADSSNDPQLFDSGLLRQVEYTFKHRPNPHAHGPIHLSAIRIMADDGQWADVFAIRGDGSDTNVESTHAEISAVARNTSQPIGASRFSLANATNMGANLSHRLSDINLAAGGGDPVISLLIRAVVKYLDDAFFFNPFRHSSDRLEVRETAQLSPTGENLAQVLHSIHVSNGRMYADIERFIHEALPDLGPLETPLVSNNTKVTFRPRDGDYHIDLHNMGGGIEQLLMIAVALLTTNEDRTLFVEEPESHLHPGAQRFLIEQFSESARQVFLTTHSPTFVNTFRKKGLYQVNFAECYTYVRRVNRPDELEDVLEDIGSRNSDLLLSDAVLFVEGTGDQRVLQTWSQTLNLSLEGHNITIVPMDRGRVCRS